MRSFWLVSALAGMSLLGLVAPSSSSRMELRTPFSFDQTEAGDALAWVSPDAFFRPSPDSAAALQPVEGILVIEEARLNLRPELLGRPPFPGKNPRLFPSVRLDFITIDGDLVPATQDVIPAASAPHAQSSWNLIVRPGRVWADLLDDGWSRASFSFVLVDPAGGEPLNGMAAFLYRGAEIRDLRYQIEQRSGAIAPSGVFSAAGTLPARFEPGEIQDKARIGARHVAGKRASQGRAASQPGAAAAPPRSKL